MERGRALPIDPASFAGRIGEASVDPESDMAAPMEFKGTLRRALVEVSGESFDEGAAPVRLALTAR